jgi:hypothetical protein
MSSDSGSATYQPDEGWAITNYYVSVNSGFGNTSKSISYVQANSSLVTESEIQDTYNMLINAALQEGLEQYKAALQIERDSTLSARHSIASSNRAIVAEAHCSGEGLGQGGASLDFDIYTDEMFIGSSNDLAQIRSHHLQAIHNAGHVQRVLWAAGSSVFRQNGTNWEEWQSGGVAHRFVQEAQDMNFIYLYDQTRNLHLALGVGRGYWRQGTAGPWNYWTPGNWGQVG